MVVVVRYLSVLESAANTSKDEYTVSDDSTTRELMAAIAERHGQAMRALIYGEGGGIAALVVVHGKIVPDDYRLRQGDEVTFFLPLSGG